MSAWPEAYYIINQLSNQFDLSNRVLRLEKRIIVFAKTKTGVREPDLTDITVPGITFTEGSLWFVEKEGESKQIYALSIYSEQTDPGSWSDFHILSVDINNISFTPDPNISILNNITDIGAAINKIASEIGQQTGIQNATTTNAGIVKIGANIDVENGEISIPTANEDTIGVMYLFDDVDGNSTNGTVTQDAINDALAEKLSSITIGNITLNTESSTSNTIQAANFRTGIGLGAAATKGTTTSVTSGSNNLITSGGVYDTTNPLATRISTLETNTGGLATNINNLSTTIDRNNTNKLITLTKNRWSSTPITTSDGVELYTQTINTGITIYNENPVIGIGAPTSRTPAIPFSTEMAAFALLYSAVANTTNNSITFYATAIPDVTFYVIAKGVA